MASQLRLFIAIELTDALRTSLAALQNDLKRQLSPRVVRWTNPDGIHLTLKFLGDTPADRVEAIARAMEAAAVSFAPFSFTVAGFGCFPNLRRAKACPKCPRRWPGCSAPPICI